MAIAIMGGLTVATVLTIFFVPALYAAWFKVRRAGAPSPRRRWCLRRVRTMTNLDASLTTSHAPALQCWFPWLHRLPKTRPRRCSTNCGRNTKPWRSPPDDRGDVEGFEAIDARMRKAFRWLEQAIGLPQRPASRRSTTRTTSATATPSSRPRFAHGSVGLARAAHRRLPGLEAIDVYYEIAASKPLSIEVVPGWVAFAAKTLDAFGLNYTTAGREESADGSLQKCVFSVPRSFRRAFSFRIDHRQGHVTVSLPTSIACEPRGAGVPEHRHRRAGAGGPRATDARSRCEVPPTRAAGGPAAPPAG
jgi:hypothetical protein